MLSSRVRICSACMALLILGVFTRASGKGLSAPFTSEPHETMETAAKSIWEADQGERALEMGFYSIAESFFQQALGLKNLPASERNRLTLRLTATLIGEHKTTDAEKTLSSYGGDHGPGYGIVAAALAFQKRDYAGVDSALKGIQPGQVSPPDIGWYHFLHAMSFEHAGKQGKADAEFQLALKTAVSSAEKAQFQLGQFQARLKTGKVDQGMAAQLRRQMEDFQGKRIGFQFAQQYAVVLNQLGQKQQAIAVLQHQSQLVPVEEGKLRDQLLLLLGLVSGVDSTVGRDAYRNLLMTGTDSDLQRVALQKLGYSVLGPNAAGAAAFRKLLDSLIERQPAHPLLEELLYFRGMLSLQAAQFDEADAIAHRLLSQFPGSRLKKNALALLASSAWQRKRYRTAGDYIGQIRQELPEGSKKADLAVVLADCYFRAGVQAGTPEDFKNAANAYGMAMNEKPPSVPEGVLFFQRILSEIRAGEVDRAKTLLDAQEKNPEVDALSLWQSEWNLVKALQIAGNTSEAYERLARLSNMNSLPRELLLRFLWLRARLSLDAGRPAETPALVDAVEAFLAREPAAAIPADLRRRVSSNAALLKAEALLDSDQVKAGVAALEKLRSKFPGSRAAIYSYIVQARFLTQTNQIVDAQQLLIHVADNYKNSEYAPLALYEAALNAERRGQDAYLKEANQLLETLATKYPKDDFLFYSRLNQADLLRKLNQFSAAQQIYEFLVNHFPDRPDRILAQLSLADCLMAQAATDPAKFEGAVSRLERLFDLPNAPVDLRVEAGYKLGAGWQNQGDPNRAMQAYWGVYSKFMTDPKLASSLQAKGRYWMARTLFALGGLLEKDKQLDNARKIYETIIHEDLPGADLAKARMSRFVKTGSASG